MVAEGTASLWLALFVDDRGGGCGEWFFLLRGDGEMWRGCKISYVADGEERYMASIYFIACMLRGSALAASSPLLTDSRRHHL